MTKPRAVPQIQQVFFRLRVEPNPILSGGTGNNSPGPANDPVHPQFERLWSVTCFAPRSPTFVGDASIGRDAGGRVASVTLRLWPDGQPDNGVCWMFTATRGFSTFPSEPQTAFAVSSVEWRPGPNGSPDSVPTIVNTLSGAPAVLAKVEIPRCAHQEPPR